MTPTTDTPKTSTHHPRSMSTNIPTPSRSFSSSSGTGIPAFRSLRSLLPFGPGKSSSSTPAKAAASTSFSSTSSPSATVIKTPNTNTQSLSKAAGHGYSLSVSQTQGNGSFGAGRSFTTFGTVRRSMTKERGMGEGGSRPSGSFLRPSTKVAEETFDDVIAIGPEPSSTRDVSADMTDESGLNTPLRRSVSYPRLDKEIVEQDSRDLSTIIEADTSGLSRYLPDLNTSQTSSPSRSPPSRNSPLTRTQSDSLLRPVSTYLTSGSSSSRYSASTQPSPTDNELELSVSNVQGQVLDALLVKDYAAAREWLDSRDAVVVDDDEDLTQTQPLRRSPPPPDSRVSIEFGPLDPELTALLSPNRLSGSSSPKRQSLSSRRSSVQLSSRTSSQRNSLSTPFALGQGAENPPTSLPRPVSIPSRSLVVLPSSSLPSSSPLSSPPISASPPHSPFVPPVFNSPRPSPLATTTIFPSRSSRPSSPERRLQHSYQPAPPSPLRGESSGALGHQENQEPGLVNAESVDPSPVDEAKEPMKESTESQRIQRDYQARTKPSALLPRLITPSRRPSSPSSPIKDTDATPESYEARLPSRRTFTTPSPALQIPRSARSLSNRPSPASSVVGDATINASPATTSMIMDDAPSARPRPSLDESRLEMGSSRTSAGRRGLTHIQMKTRMRKRSMSVENGSPGLSIGSAANHGSPSEFGTLSVPRDDDATLNGLRSSSSLSNRREGGSSGSQRTLDWMGPRAATRAFAAAGLLPLDRDRDREFEQDVDRERDRERDRRLDLAGIRSVTPTLERTNSRAVTPNNFGGSTAQGLSRYGSQRGGASDFRAQSRMAFSESAGPSVAGSRKGSGSYSAANSHNNTPSSYGNSSSYGSATTGTRYTGRERGGSVSVSVAGSAVSPLMESPTLSESMRGRGTPMSVSTAPTSILSGASERGRGFGVDRERDKERERLEAEMERMRDKHSLEMGALLSALSDSQRTTKVLREENTSLRDRLDSAVEEVHMLRSQCEEWKWEVEMLRGNSTHAGNESVFGGGSVPDGRNSTPQRWRSLRGWGSEAGGRDVDGNASIGGRARGLGLGLPSVLQRHRERLEPGFSTAHQRRTYTPRGGAASTSVSSPQARNGQDEDLDFQTQRPFSRGVDNGQGSSDSGSGKAMPPPPPPSMKGKPQHRRRSSTTSSVFPNPPPGMAMLTRDPQSDDPDFAALASFSMTPSRPPSFASSNPRPIGPKNARANSHHKRSQSSVGNVSPTTANFSMTGSPGSLNLRPEDELHLRDMDIMSLNLRIASGDESDGE